MLKVTIKDSNICDPAKFNVLELGSNQLFRVDDGIGLKVPFGWLLFRDDEIIPYSDEEAGQDVQFNECVCINGRVDVTVCVEKD